MGTGIVIDPRGYILTNYHVVKGVEEIETTLSDGSEHIARLVARDPETDLAVIKIASSKELPVIELGTSADLMPGETVIAVGNAYGYTHTVTRGIISALHRNVQVSEAQSYEDLIQTDASINPGKLRRAASEYRRRDDRDQRSRPGGRPRHRLRYPGEPGNRRGDEPALA